MRTTKIMSGLLTAFGVAALSLSVNAQQWSGSTTSDGNINRNGNVGIGLPSGTDPSKPLHVNGSIRLGLYASETSRLSSVLNIGDLDGNNPGFSYVYMGEFEKDDYLSFSAKGFNFTRGNVGIGLAAGTEPTSKLTINGSGSSNIDLKVNGRIQTGDANNLGGVWLDNGTTQFIGQVSSTSLGLWNGGAWRMIINNSGSVGIGTDPTSNRLTVKGEIKISSAGNVGDPNMGNHANLILGDYSVVNSSNSSDTYFSISKSGNKAFYMNSLGNIGLGTSTDLTNRLTVNGTIKAEEIIVQDVGADYVFEENYKLRSLEEVEKFIIENKHLPGVAPASETEQGIKVGEFNEKLLEKIEELTLYMIDLKKENEVLKTKVSALEAEVNRK